MQARPRHSAKGPGRRVRITVRGRLSEQLATSFEGMTLSTGAGQTELVGEVVDQAQLYGLLARIRDLGLELEGVSFLAPQPPKRPRTSRP